MITPQHPTLVQQELREVLEGYALAMTRRLAEAAKAPLARLDNVLKALSSTPTATVLTALPGLTEEVQEALDSFARTAHEETRRAGEQGARGGARVARMAMDLLNVQRFVSPSLDDLMAMVGLIDSPEYLEWVRDFGAIRAALVREKILAMAGQRASGREIAETVRRYLRTQPYYDVVRMARTMQLSAARRTQHGIYRINRNILSGWIWVSAKDQRTCPSCWAMDGSFHGLDEELNDHFLGRCAPAPTRRDVAGEAPRHPTGEDVFRELPEDDQRLILGAARWRAWRDGAFAFSQLTTTTDIPIFGTMRREASLTTLVGEATARVYMRKNEEIA